MGPRGVPGMVFKLMENASGGWLLLSGRPLAEVFESMVYNDGIEEKAAA
jgi:hypothetical protein